MNRKQRKKRVLRVENLEGRQLAAADVTAWMQGDTLQIRGTERNDNVSVLVDSRTQLVRVMSNLKKEVFRTTAPVNAINASLGAGRDQFTMMPSSNVNLRSLDIDMGTGNSGDNNRERVNLNRITTPSLRISSTSTNGVNATIAGSRIGRASISLGAGSDHVNLQSGTFIDDLWARFGAGDDVLNVSGGHGSNAGRLYYNQVTNADVDLGSGHDQLILSHNSQIINGVVDAGMDGDRDLASTPARNTRVQLRRFG